MLKMRHLLKTLTLTYASNNKPLIGLFVFYYSTHLNNYVKPLKYFPMKKFYTYVKDGKEYQTPHQWLAILRDERA